MSHSELRLLVRLGLLRPIRGTADGSVTEYELTGNACILLDNNLKKDCASVLTDTQSKAKVIP